MLEAIYYFIDERGKNPVKEFIRALPWNERVKVFAYLAELREKGHELHRPLADYLGEGIYELSQRPIESSTSFS